MYLIQHDKLFGSFRVAMGATQAVPTYAMTLHNPE